MRRTRVLALLLALALLFGCTAKRGADPSVSQSFPAATEISVPGSTAVQTQIVPEPDQTSGEPESAAATQTVPPTEDPVAELVQEMSLEEKVAQMLIVTPEILTGVKGPVTVAGETTRAAFERVPVGGILYMDYNLRNPDQVRSMCENMQRISLDRTGLPVFLCVDEEGGTVARISGTGRFGIPAFENMSAVGAAGDPARAAEIGRTMGAYLRDLGLNVDFAPDADVLTEERNTVVRYRSFGSDAALVTQMTAAFADGLLEEGVLPVYKHFPGHGATAEDSHDGFAVSERTREELLACELIPFRDAAERGIPFIMIGHISLPNLTDDGLPASLSPDVVTGLLREELGFRGIVVTDALGMGAITQLCDPGEASVLAVLAGNDMLLISDHLEESFSAILDAVRVGRISEARIDESVYRILSEKKTMLP